MNFGFAPDGDDHVANLRLMFQRQANTTLIDQPAVSSVRQFIGHLDKTSTIAKPVDDLLIGAHANHEGQFLIPMFPGHTGWTKYEHLEATLSDPAKSIKIPDTLIDFKPGNPITHTVHIKGCNIGQATPFLTKLKQALGGNVKLTAPKMFHGATPAPTEGMFEYLGYQFILKRAQPFTKRKDALTEWDNAGFTLIDGNPVPTADWAKVVPADPNMTVRQQVHSKLGATFNKRTTVKTPRQHRAEEITFGPWTVPFAKPEDVPKSESDRLLELERHLKQDPRFKDTHPYPQFKREGFDRVIEFVSGYTWNFRQVGNTLDCLGRRYLYMVVVAITDPATTPPKGFFGDGTLIYNFYPNAKSKLTARTTAIQVTDAKYFVTL